MYALQNKLTLVPLTPAKIQQSSRSFVGKKEDSKITKSWQQNIPDQVRLEGFCWL